MPSDWQSRVFICSVSLYMWLLHTISSKILGPKYHLQLSHFAMSLPICFKRHFSKLHIQSCDPSKTTWHIYPKFYQWVKPKNQIVSFMTKSITSLWFLSCVWLFATPWTAARQASVSITKSWDCSNSCQLSQRCHSIIPSSVLPFSSCLQSPP